MRYFHILLIIVLTAGCTASASSDIPQDQNPASPQSGDPWEFNGNSAPKFLFIHHSTGSGFLFEGGMKDKLTAGGFEVHNRTYGDGWVGDNTDPEHWPVTFTQHFNDMVTWDLNAGEQYDIIAFKSCFPASDISSDEMFDDYVGYYETVRSVTRQHPDILFIPFSTPPLVPDATSAENAQRARAFSEWLCGEYCKNENNIRAYDLFNVLASDDPGSGDFNRLRYEYQGSPDDSHPNGLANETVADDFTSWLTGIVFGDQ